MRPKAAVVMAALAGLLLACCILAVGVGAVPLPPGKAVRILAHAFHLGPAGDWHPYEEVILMTVRLPRVLVAVLPAAAWPWPAP